MIDPDHRAPIPRDPTRESSSPLAYRGMLRDRVRTTCASGPTRLRDALHNALCALADPRAPAVTHAEFRLLREHTSGWFELAAEVDQLLHDLVLERRTSDTSPTLVLPPLLSTPMGDQPQRTEKSAWICAPDHLGVEISALSDAARAAGLRGSVRHLHVSRLQRHPRSRLTLTMDAIRGLDITPQLDDVEALRAAFSTDPPDLLISATFGHVPIAQPSADPAILSVSFACVAVLDARGRVTTYSDEGPPWIQRQSLLTSVAVQAITRARVAHCEPSP